MTKLLAAVAALFIASAAFGATYGTPPTPATGPGLVDGTWLNALAGGQNQAVQSGISAAGSTQAGATQLGAGISLFSIDTVASSTGVALPMCLAGSRLSIYNNGANTLTVYPTVPNNSVTGSQDTINNGTSTTQTTHVSKTYYCPENGVWAAQ